MVNPLDGTGIVVPITPMIGGASTLIIHFYIKTEAVLPLNFVNYKNGGIFIVQPVMVMVLNWSGHFIPPPRKPSAGDVGALPLSGGQQNGALGYQEHPAFGGLHCSDME